MSDSESEESDSGASEDDRIPQKRVRLPPAVISWAQKYVVNERRPVGGCEGVAELLRNGGFEVSDQHLRRLKRQGWRYKQYSRGHVKFSNDDLALVIEISLQNPTVRKRRLPELFYERTGRWISPSHAWMAAKAALLFLPAVHSPQLCRPHFLLREHYHRLILRHMSVLPVIVWTDECCIAYNPANPNQKTFCVSRDDPRRNVPQPQETRKFMIHGAVSLEWGGLPVHIFPADTIINDAVYADLINVHYRPWLECHPAAIWQQDNATPHTSAAVMSILRNFQRLSFWPPHSPDFNPIEFVWMALKASLYSHEFHSEAELASIIHSEWRRLTQPFMFRSQLDRALENLERSRLIGYATVH